MLANSEIRAMGLVSDASESRYRAASYDVGVWRIVTPTGELVETYQLPPMGIVELISIETLHIPIDVCALAHVKTSLCNEGLLTLNTGIVDPGWNGRLSSTVLNFGKNAQLIVADEVFLRITFHRLIGAAATVMTSPSDDEYIRERRRNVVDGFSASFLDLPTLITSTVEKTVGQYRVLALAYIPALAIFLTILTFLLNFGTLSLVQKWIQPSEAAKAELVSSNLARQTEILHQVDEALKTRIENLEDQTREKDSATPER